MRGELTAALLHDPAIVYLDEPTIGLDVVSKAKVREFLAHINRERRVTIVLTTHDLDDVEQLCSRLVVVDQGRVVHDGTVNDVKHRFAPHRTVIVDLFETSSPLALTRASVVRVDGPRQWVEFHRDDSTAAEVIAEIVATTPIRDLTIVEPDIEDVIRRIHGSGVKPQADPEVA
jgi:ABC-2 type transport system ATP-binding protein